MAYFPRNNCILYNEEHMAFVDLRNDSILISKQLRRIYCNDLYHRLFDRTSPALNFQSLYLASMNSGTVSSFYS